MVDNSNDLAAQRLSFPNVSQYSDSNSIVTRYMDLVPADEYAVDEINTLPWFDPLDDRMQKLLRQISNSSPITYLGEPITTVSQNAYGNTSLWWVIVLYNGFTHPDEIPRNTQIKIPELSAALSKRLTQRSQAGQKVTV